MSKYHKINSVFKRDGKRFTDEFSCPEFEYLKDLPWIGTEKVDGTNVRLYKNGDIKGRTDNAQFAPKTFLMLQRYSEILQQSDLPDNTILYGEGYGASIQKGGTYLPDSQDFVLFDVSINGNYQSLDSVQQIANQLNIKAVPVLGLMSLIDWVAAIQSGKFKQSILHPSSPNEGVVLKPAQALHTRIGERIITKLKFKDFLN